MICYCFCFKILLGVQAVDFFEGLTAGQRLNAPDVVGLRPGLGFGARPFVSSLSIDTAAFLPSLILVDLYSITHACGNDNVGNQWTNNVSSTSDWCMRLRSKASRFSLLCFSIVFIQFLCVRKKNVQSDPLSVQFIPPSGMSLSCLHTQLKIK